MATVNLGRVVGKSAYEVWLDAGNTGTEADYLESLKGEVTQAQLNAVTSQLLEKATAIPEPAINIATALEYGSISTTGTLGNETNTTSLYLRSSDYIPVENGGTYTLYIKDFLPSYNAAYYTCLYDENHIFLERILQSGGLNITAGRYVQSFTIANASAKYIKFYINTPAINDVYFPWKMDGSDLMLVEGAYTAPFSSPNAAQVQVAGLHAPYLDAVVDEVANMPRYAFWRGILREAYGSYVYAPRNTVESVLCAKRLGFKYLKCDCRITSDNEIVLCHDATLNLSTDYTGAATIRSMTLAEVKATAIVQNRYAYTVRVATLDEFLFECKRQGIIPFVNLRDEYLDDVVPAVANLLVKYGFDATAIVQSTDITIASLLKFRQHNTKCLCMLVLTANTTTHGPTLEHLQRVLMIGRCALCVHDNNNYITTQATDFAATSKAVIAAAHALGIPVVYAIADATTEPTAITIGYDGVMTYAVPVEDVLTLKSANGTVYKLTVGDDGVISTAPFNPALT